MGYTHNQVLRALRGFPIGGGIGHTPDITADDATDVVRTRARFARYAGDANAVLWIPDDATINLTGWSGKVRATIASDRGVDGSPGGLLYTTDHGDDSHAWDGGSGMGVLQMYGSARLSGVRFRGPYHDHYNDPRHPGYIPIDSGDGDARQRKRERRYARGMSIYSDGVEVDNCELYGWPNQAIMVGSRSIAASPHIHHIYGHDCMMVGYGYAIDIIRGEPEIEDSYFNATRHSIAGFGYDDCGYTVENSIFGPITYSHAVDMHCLAENGFNNDLTAGSRVEVRNCTFTTTENIRGDGVNAIAFRGYPEEEYVVANCRFAHEIDGEEPPENGANTGGDGAPYRQVNVPQGEWHDWSFHNNQYGTDAPYRPRIGAAINLNDPYGGRRRMQMLRGLEETEASLVALRNHLTATSPDSSPSDVH